MAITKYFMGIINFLICFSDMSQFSLGTANSHWGYSSSGYSPYLTGSGLTSCATPTAAQFNNPALGFTCSSTEPNGGGQEFGGTSGGVNGAVGPGSTANSGNGGGATGGGNGRDCVPSECNFVLN